MSAPSDEATEAPELRIESRGVAMQLRRLRVAVAWALFAVSIFALGACLWFPLPLVSFGAFVVLIGSAIALLRLKYEPVVSPPRERMVAATVRIAAGHLLVERPGRATPVWSRPLGGDVVGWLEPVHDSVVVLRVGPRILFAVVATQEEARALLAAARVSPEHQTLRLPIASPLGQAGAAAGCLSAALGLVLPVVALIAGIVVIERGVWTDPGVWKALAVGLSALAFFALLVRTLTPRTIVIGTDGIAFRGWLRRRFVPYSQVHAVHEHRRGVLVELAGGGRNIYLAAREGTEGAAASMDEVAPRLTLLRRIQDAMTAGRRSAAAERRLEALDRGGSSLAAWRERVRSLVGPTAGYRAAATLDSEDALRALEDASAPPERRIAAALALSPVGDPGTKVRIRRVIDTCADEDLRAALETAAEDELTEERLRRAVPGNPRPPRGAHPGAPRGPADAVARSPTPGRGFRRDGPPPARGLG